jgi:hypothetical protein
MITSKKFRNCTDENSYLTTDSVEILELGIWKNHSWMKYNNSYIDIYIY